MKKEIAIFLIIFYGIGITGYVICGVHQLDNQDVKFPVWNEIEINDEIFLKKTWEIKNVGYDPSISYWIVSNILIIGLGVTFILSNKIEKPT